MSDETHDPARTSWVESANGHPDFPIQNLPFGVFSIGNGEARAGGVVGFIDHRHLGSWAFGKSAQARS